MRSFLAICVYELRIDFDPDRELSDRGWTLLHMMDEGARNGRIILPVGEKLLPDADDELATYLTRTDGWDGYEVSVVPPSAHRRANLRVAGSETEPPIWYLPLEDSSELLRLPIGTRTRSESAAEVIGRSHLDRSEAIERQIALMPYSRAAFPDLSSILAGYSAAQVYFASGAIGLPPIST